MLKRKNILIIYLFMVIAVSGLAVDKKANEIVKKCKKAMEISTKIKDMKIIKFVENPSKSKRESQYYIKRPNKIYKTYSPDGLILMFDGKRAYVLKGKNVEGVVVKKPEVLPKDHWWHFEFDIALIFPVIFDYPGTFVGEEIIEGIKHYELSIKMPLDTIFSYFVNSKTHLIFKVRMDHKNAKGKMIRIERFFTNYKQTGGILLPHTNSSYSKETGKKRETIYKAIEINPRLEGVTFEFPKEL